MPTPEALLAVRGPDAVERRLVDYLHGGFPLSDEPYAEVGRALGLSEDAVLALLRRMLAQGLLTRFGPLYQIERAGGEFVLAALQVPTADFDRVAQLVNALPEVAHNYRREHALNMWFVVAAESRDAARSALQRIEALTGLPVFAFPKEREYFVGLRLPAAGQEAAREVADAAD
jgi:DNA-binding Lrp family transcriptional regulator